MKETIEHDPERYPFGYDFTYKRSPEQYLIEIELFRVRVEKFFDKCLAAGWIFEASDVAQMMKPGKNLPVAWAGKPLSFTKTNAQGIEIRRWMYQASQRIKMLEENQQNAFMDTIYEESR